MSEQLRFPAGFAWGAATASYQIEGAVAEDGRTPSIWDTHVRKPGAIANGDVGDVAVDHYHRYREDVQLLADIGATHYRFSLAWPRLQPDGRGELNPAGVDFYDRLLDALHEAGVQPWVTIYHWDLPQRLEDEGGWPARDTALRFVDYATRVHDRFRDRMTAWTTLNEPWCSSYLSYADGEHAPGRSEPAAAVRAAHHLLLGHGLAIRAMREAAPEHDFGVTVNLYAVDPASPDPADVDAARRIDGLMNRSFLDPLLRGTYPKDVLEDLSIVIDAAHIEDGDLETIAQPLDFLGINYYSRHVTRAGSGERVQPGRRSPWPGSHDVEFVERGVPKTAMGWEIDPQGLYDVLTRVHREYAPPPLYVTENGAAFDDRLDETGRVADPERIAYLDSHFRAAHRALTDGVDLRGYFIWTLTDNFEWAHGFSKRFGLAYVDYDTLERIPNDSARWFAEVTRRNGLRRNGL